MKRILIILLSVYYMNGLFAQSSNHLSDSANTNNKSEIYYILVQKDIDNSEGIQNEIIFDTIKVYYKSRQNSSSECKPAVSNYPAGKSIIIGSADELFGFLE